MRLRPCQNALSTAAIALLCLLLISLLICPGAQAQTQAAAPGQGSASPSGPSAYTPGASNAPPPAQCTAPAPINLQSLTPMISTMVEQRTNETFEKGWLHHVDELRDAVSWLTMIVATLGILIPLGSGLFLYLFDRRKGEDEQRLFHILAQTLEYLTRASEEISGHRERTRALERSMEETKNDVERMSEKTTEKIANVEESIPIWMVKSQDSLEQAKRQCESIIWEIRQRVHVDMMEAADTPDGLKKIVRKMGLISLLIHDLHKVLYGEVVQFCEALEEISDDNYVIGILPKIQIWNFFNLLYDQGRIHPGIQMSFLQRFAEKTGTFSAFEMFRIRMEEKK